MFSQESSQAVFEMGNVDAWVRYLIHIAQIDVSQNAPYEQ